MSIIIHHNGIDHFCFSNTYLSELITKDLTILNEAGSCTSRAFNCDCLGARYGRHDSNTRCESVEVRCYFILVAQRIQATKYKR